MATEAECLAYATQLAQAREAYHALMTGKATVSVSYADKTVTYSQASANNLLAYINSLQDLVDGCAGTRTGRRVTYLTPGG